MLRVLSMVIKKSFIFNKSKFIILYVLHEAELNKEKLHMSMLMKRSGLFRSTLIDHVRELEILEFLKCCNDDHDKRYVNVELTLKGKNYIDDYLRFCNNNGVEVLA